MKKLLLFVPLWLVAYAFPATAQQQCLPLLNQLTKPLIQSALQAGQGKVCQKVPRYTETRSLRVAAIKVCPEGEAIVISGTIDVTCGTPADAILPGEINEIVDFQGKFDLAGCELRNVTVSPRGAFGKVVASALDLQTKLANRLNRQLEMFCR